MRNDSITEPVPEQEESEVPQNIPAIDMAGTGKRISELRTAAGLSVKDMQDYFGFATPQAIYKCSTEWQCRRLTIS